ncbi:MULTISPECIES: STAS domain-containing protein [Actinoplanes]|uniref:STAS domain-containing protein n=1 Tax=Actinoplanes TaxID=1865 RepID=UPI0005F29FE8|nr:MULTISPECIES: STAS domain-containing protein [Actinoplanes]GLX99846.1 anti-sigma factor antagonist [Actinoplanes sp. NBRC 101535]
MKISETSDEASGVATLSVSGRLDSLEAGNLRRAIDLLIDNGCTSLTIDLTKIVFMDSAGLAAVVQAHRRLQFSGGELVVVRPAEENANRVFELTQFDKMLTMRDAAIER